MANGQSSLPTFRTTRSSPFGSSRVFSAAACANRSRSVRSATSSPDEMTPLPSGPKMASSAASSSPRAAATSALTASSGDENVHWPAAPAKAVVTATRTTASRIVVTRMMCILPFSDGVRRHRLRATHHPRRVAEIRRKAGHRLPPTDGCVGSPVVAAGVVARLRSLRALPGVALAHLLVLIRDPTTVLGIVFPLLLVDVRLVEGFAVVDVHVVVVLVAAAAPSPSPSPS